MSTEISLDTSQITQWRSIVTLIVFVFTNINVLFPFKIPIFIPRWLSNTVLDVLAILRIISPREGQSQYGSDQVDEKNDQKTSGSSKSRNGISESKKMIVTSRFVRVDFPMNFVTAPLIADLFLLAILAIGRKEVHDGTIGADNISPIDIMAFFITLAYIAISIDASGLIRYLAFKVLQKAGKVGHRLYFYLYAFFFCLASFIGNDPIILSGTAFLAYMTRVSSNIKHPRAWIHTQFALANIASTILVSSNPTNLVLAGAFSIKFIVYSANMIVPVVVTVIVLYPILLYIVFADESLIPYSIKMHELPDEAKAKKPVNPNIPHARGTAEEKENEASNEEGKVLSLEEIMNPFVDKAGAAFGAVLMAVTLITLVGLNAADQSTGEHPVFWVTLPAAFIMLCWDISLGWWNRHETREIARKGREEVEYARAERIVVEQEEREAEAHRTQPQSLELQRLSKSSAGEDISSDSPGDSISPADDEIKAATDSAAKRPSSTVSDDIDEKKAREIDRETRIRREIESRKMRGPPTLVSHAADLYRWCQETLPTATAVVAHLPFALIPFAFCMFVLVQALSTKGWVAVFAYGWDHWVSKTGTVGCIGGMAFLSVIMCNFAGTNIGTTILLSRIIQTWVQIHKSNHIPITERAFWGTVYSMALGVNYGAFSMAFSASLAGLLWRDILARKHIRVRSLDFARVNLPVIAVSMSVGCAVLVGEIYLTRGNSPYVQ